MKQTFGKTERVGFQVTRIRAESKNIVQDEFYSSFRFSQFDSSKEAEGSGSVFTLQGELNACRLIWKASEDVFVVSVKRKVFKEESTNA